MKATTDLCRIGFGCWGIGGQQPGAPPAYGTTDDRESRRALERALARGVNFFDTSGLYGAGHSEKLVGEVAGREPVVLATKAGYLSADGAQDFRPETLERALRESLVRLGRVDLFQLHDPPPEVLGDEKLWETLLRWRHEGRFRFLGASLRRPADARLVLGRVPLDALQLNFSLIDQRARTEGILEACAEVAVIARTPLAFGYLAGAQSLGPQDHRLRFSERQRELWEAARERFCALVEGPSPAARALRYCLSYPAVSVAIPGMLTPDHVDDNLQVLDLPPLTNLAAVEALYSELTLVEPSRGGRSKPWSLREKSG